VEGFAAVGKHYYPVLIVGDNDVTRSTLEGQLRGLGYPVLSVDNAQYALERLITGRYPIIFTDMVMSGLDGLELCRIIRKRRSENYTYFIMLASDESRAGILAALDAGADECLTKPIDPAELTARLKTACRILDLESSLKKNCEEVRASSIRDPLTKVFNRGYLEERLAHEVKRAFRFCRALAVVMFDLDNFKLINDTFGHAAGDQVLTECAWLMGATIRQEIDWIARYGGEEFTVILPETSMAGARIAAERMRFRLASHDFIVGGMELTVTASFGVAAFTPASQKEDMSMGGVLLAKADTCLYQAKREGRNRVISVQL
jgi:two-component system, cell cycle response regulator